MHFLCIPYILLFTPTTDTHTLSQASFPATALAARSFQPVVVYSKLCHPHSASNSPLSTWMPASTPSSGPALRCPTRLSRR